MKSISILGFALNICNALAAQPAAPSPINAPLRDLKFGNINFLHTTDTHGWHAGHLLEASYSADWGDYIDFAGRLREKIEHKGHDLLVVDTGDRIEGNGLYDGDEPKGLHTFEIFTNQHIDLICSGNHELYKQNSSENELHVTVPAYHDAYIASNLDIYDQDRGTFIPLAQRYKKFTTKKQGVRITAFGFLFDFTDNYNNTIVTPVEKAIQETWFQDVIRDREVDLFVVIGHAGVRSDEFTAIYKAIRQVQWDTPIQFFGGHFHIRDYKKFDSKSYGLASGRFMETIGFQSIDGITGPNKTAATSSPTFFRSYIDNNLHSMYHHSGHNASTFHTDFGRKVTKQIQKARSELALDAVYGCAPQDYWMSRAPYPNNTSIFTWLEQHVFPEQVIDTDRANKSRIILSNTGAIRFDIFQGQFTKDSTFIVSPFTSGFNYIKDVRYEIASKVLGILNIGGPMTNINSNSHPNFQDLILDTSKLAPLEQQHRIVAPNNKNTIINQNTNPSQQTQLLNNQFPPINIKTNNKIIIPGYTTKDDLDSEGDDTVHSPIPYYNVPNVIGPLILRDGTVYSPSTRPIPPISLTDDNNKDDGNFTPPEIVDVVFNQFLQPYVLRVLQFLGAEYGSDDVQPYVYGETMTDLILDWITEHWPCDDVYTDGNERVMDEKFEL